MLGSCCSSAMTMTTIALHRITVSVLALPLCLCRRRRQVRYFCLSNSKSQSDTDAEAHRNTNSASSGISHSQLEQQRMLLDLESEGDGDGDGDRDREREGGRRIKVSVWWDFENCSVPNGVAGLSVCQRIVAALRATGVRGPVSIRAYGDVSQLSRSTQEALRDTGVSVSHVASDGNGGADRALLVDLVFWASQNPPPAHVLLISGDGDFSAILHILRMKNYNILLACRKDAPASLCNAASIVWEWSSLVKGIRPLGKQTNYPPDGSPNSWYQEVLEDLDSQGSSDDIIWTSEGPNDLNDQIPISLKQHIAEALSPHPNGLRLSILQQKLESKGLKVSPKYYGYRRFRNLLLAMSDILIIKYEPINKKYGPYIAYPRKAGIHKLKSQWLASELAELDREQKSSNETDEQEKHERSINRFLRWIYAFWNGRKAK